MQQDLIQFLESFVTPRRTALMNAVLNKRTRYITVVLEDIFQPHNASAVLRSCDCFGIQDVHIIEQRNKYEISPEVDMGSSKWLNLYRYKEPRKNNIKKAVQFLKKNNYRIVATTPHTDDVMVENFDLGKGKVALLFGTELNGLTPEIIELSDEFLKIPMFGFTESLNISVSAAIILHDLTHRLHVSDIDWKLNDEEFNTIKLDWLRKTIKKSGLLEKKFYENMNNNPKDT
ncbi:MAG: RNA methyltransferase [Bacteroidales bacterium]|nr:RNA methyltransferase [Bacteroidales bacterium]